MGEKSNELHLNFLKSTTSNTPLTSLPSPLIPSPLVIGVCGRFDVVSVGQRRSIMLSGNDHIVCDRRGPHAGDGLERRGVQSLRLGINLLGQF